MEKLLITSLTGTYQAGEKGGLGKGLTSDNEYIVGNIVYIGIALDDIR